MDRLPLAVVIGIVTGMRAMMAPAAVSWAARLGHLGLTGWLAFLDGPWTPWILTLLAAGELITDQLPMTPSRTVPVQFGTRLLVGAICGAAIAGSPAGVVAGIVGALVGTLGGRALRARLARSFGSDFPAALTEDAIAIALALLVVRSL